MGSDHCQGQRDISSHGSVQACLPAYINYSELIGFSVSLLCRSSAKKDFEVGLRVAKSLFKHTVLHKDSLPAPAPLPAPFSMNANRFKSRCTTFTFHYVHPVYLHLTGYRRQTTFTRGDT